MDKEDLLSEYNKKIQEEVEEAYEKATHCKRKGEDPLPEVEIDLAEDIAGRSEKLLGIENLAEEMRKLEEQDYSREEITFEITDKICQGKIGDFENKAEKVEGAVRASVAILTEGIVAAPIDGIGEIEIDKNDDGTKFVRIPYFGPIRSAGGTGQALSVLVADYARRKLDISEYKPRNEEVERYVEELRLYDEEQNLQYLPPGDDIREIIRNTPVMLDGEQTTDKEVDGYRDLDRIKGNKGRGGMCLVVGEGIGLKAPKIKKYTDKIDELKGWEWIDKLIEEETDEEEDEQEQETQNQKLPKEQLHNHDKFKEEHKPHKKYLGDALAGRPLLAEPNTKGGFRLRYGRARNTGLASWGLNPATMYIVKELVAIGTQLKTEQPGKAAGISPVDSIQGPTVRLKTGEMKRIDDVKEARKQRNNIDKIIDLGEIAVPVGEYIENNHYLMPSSYVHEWWKKEPNAPKNINPEKLKWKQAINISLKKEIPLHPKYTYLYHDITTQNLETLSQNKNKIENTLEFPQTEEIQKTIETLLIPNKIKDNKIIITGEHAKALNASIPNKINHNKTVIQNISKELKVKIKPRALTRIGARMGRPEKAKKREMDPPVHALFPIGRKGGNTRNLQKASKNTDNNNQNIQNNNQKTNTQQGTVKTQLSTRECLYCETKTWRIRCPNCEKRTYPHYQCPKCEKPGEKDKTCKKCNREYQQYKKQTLSIKNTLNEATTKLNINPNTLNTIKAVKGLTSKTKIPEPLEKGILRAKHGIQTFRDGTSRYDMVDLPLTSFKPKEVNIPIKKLKQLGYTHDKNGNPLENQNQKLELYPQDIILNEDCGDYLLKVANYIDELLVKYYNEDPYYNAENKEDLIGELIVGLAPHTSGGLVGRIIGYTPAKTNYANPLYHAGKRRNCFHPETKLNYKINGEWKQTTIETLVEKYIKPSSDGYDDQYTDGSIVQDIRKISDIEELKVPSVTDEGYRTLEDITHLSKHKPGKMLKIRFEDGDKIKVTHNHSMSIKSKENIIEERDASEIEAGDIMYDCSEELLYETQQYKEIDVLEHLLNNKNEHNIDLENIMIRGMKKEEVYELFEEEINIDKHKMKESCQYLNIDKKTLDNYLRRESIPVSLILKLYDNDINKTITNLPKNVKLGLNRDNTKIPRIIDLDQELACLIGYYTAEGFTRHTQDDERGKSKTGVRQVDIAATEEESKKFIKKVFSKKLGVDNYYENETRLTFSGTLLTYVFSEIIDSGRLAHKKKVPNLIKESSDKIKGHYLNGYISGDGSSISNSLESSTVSKKLHNNIKELFNSLGYETRSYVEEKVKLKEKFPDYYDKYNEKMSRDVYRLNIKDPDKFVKNYGVQLTRKQEHLQKKGKTKIVKSVEECSYRGKTYNLTVKDTNRLEVNNVIASQSDGDEDSVMLLMDGFLNFSEQYLPDRRGKRSVTKDTMVLVKVDGDVRAVEISELVDGVFEDDGFEVRDDGFEVNRVFDEDIKVVSFDAEGEVGFRDVSALVRHVNDKDVYDVQTSGGSISVTEDHSIFVLDDNDIVERSVGGLEKGEKVVVPSYTDVFSGDDNWWGYSGESLVRVIEERYNVDLDGCSTVSVGSGKEAFMLSMALRKLGFDTSSFEDGKVWVVEFGDDVSDLDNDLVDGDLGVERVIDISKVDYGDDYVYDLEVPGTQNFLCGPHPIFAHNTMDAPLVLTTELDPEEVDDEAYNVETVGELSREFYESSFRLEHPEDTGVEVKEDDLSHGMGFDSVIGTDSIHEGCHENFYKRAGGMEDKTWEHMILEERLKGVDEGYVAEVIIEKHLMPDLIGNLTAFSRQETRCAKCNTKYRRVPLDGNCGNCGNDLILTIHEGSVKKYIEITDELISKYDVSDYTRERVEILKDRVDAVFDNDKVTQTGIGDFMG